MSESKESDTTNNININNNNNSLLKGLRLTVGDNLFQKITTSKILLVGSGGIGCELLKNLSLSGFTHVEVIDLDTIDVSNLNRQFLFRSQHVGLPKCTVACNAALDMLPVVSGDGTGSGTGSGSGTNASTRTKYIAHHGNVCDNTRFNVNYIKNFDLVLNALDNVAARRRVNRLCLAASIPLIEAGTTGYLGQVTVIDKPSNTECYECQAKPTQKVYPICTIRSTPSMPVHTIVWAKELYKLFFGKKVEESMLFEDQTGDEPSTYMDLVLELRSLFDSAVVTTTSSDDTATNGTNDNGNNDNDNEAKVRELAGKTLIALYHTEIQKQLQMDRFKTAQKVPTSIPIDMIQNVVQEQQSSQQSSQPPQITPSKKPTYKQTDILSQKDCITEVISCITDAYKIVVQSNKNKSSSNDNNNNNNNKDEKLLPDFDKDDKIAMRLVTFASNLRSYVFGIDPIQSYYSAKGIAGNIIPAIATTNAIVAGLQILSAFSILKAQLENENNNDDNNKQTTKLKESCRYTYCLRNKSRKGYYLQPTTLPDPNPNCFVCKNAVINLTINTTKWTLGMLLRRIIKKELGFMEPSLLLESSIIYEEGDDIGEDEYSMNVGKLLVDLPAGGVKGGTVIRIEDFTQDLEVDVCVFHKSEWEKKDGNGSGNGVGEEEEEEEKFIVGGAKPVVASDDQNKGSGGNDDDQNDDDDDDDDIEIVTESQVVVTHDKKRSAIDIEDDNENDQDQDQGGGPKKKTRTE